MKSFIQKTSFILFWFTFLNNLVSQAQDDIDYKKAKVYIYCNSSVTIQKNRFFYVDNELAAKVHEKNYIIKEFSPGEHKFYVFGGKQKVIRVPEREFILKKLEAGKSYYFLILNGSLSWLTPNHCILIEVTSKFAHEYLTNFTQQNEN